MMDNLKNTEYFFTFLWVFLISLLGAITAYIKKKRESGQKFNFLHLVGDILISFFLGVITYFICKGANINDFWTAGFVGLVSHLGTRALVLFDVLIPVLKEIIQKVFPKVVCKWFGVECTEKEIK